MAEQMAVGNEELVRRFFEVWNEGNWEEAEGTIDIQYLGFFQELCAALPDLDVSILEAPGAIKAIGSDAVVAFWTAEGTTAPIEIEKNGERRTIPADVLVKIWGTSTFSISGARIQEAQLAVVSRTSSDTMDEDAWVVWAFDSDALKEEQGEDWRRQHPICRCTPIC